MQEGILFSLRSLQNMDDLPEKTGFFLTKKGRFVKQL